MNAYDRYKSNLTPDRVSKYTGVAKLKNVRGFDDISLERRYIKSDR